MILIIDSEKKPENKLKQSFVESGFRSVVLVRSAEQARDLFQSYELENTLDKITLIIIANDLDDTDEFEFSREIRKIECIKNTYIILLVSSPENKTAIEKAKQSGASDFSVKPYDSDYFKNRFLRYMKYSVVVLVEDDVLIRQMVRGMLCRYYLEIIEIDDGIDAHNLFNIIMPVRFIVMDIGLPNMNGIKLIEHVRSKANWNKTPVIMLTGSSDASDVKKCMLAGAKEYITKPFKINEFVKHIDRYLPDAN
jgi:twitching motility two-component system response regulator PilG